MATPEVQQRYQAMLDAAREMARQGTERGLPPEAVARSIRDALTQRSPAPRRLVGRDAKLMAAMVRLLPDRLVYRMLRARH